MFQPRSLALLALSFLLLLPLASPVAADEGKSVEQLYAKFMEQYKAGDFEEALETSRDIQPVHLPSEKRVALYEAIQDIQRKGQNPKNIDELLKQAERAQDKGDLGRAVALYETIRASENATKKQKATAAAGLAEVNRKINSQLSDARKKLAEAESLIQAGKIEQASQNLTQVQESGLDLGWFDNNRLANLLAQVNEAQRAADFDANEPGFGQVEVKTANAMPTAADAGADATISDSKKARAAQLVAEGQSALDDQRYETALARFREAQEYDPTNQEAVAGARQASQELTVDDGPKSIGDIVTNASVVEQQQIIAEANSSLARAKAQLDQGKYDEARDSVTQAKLTLDGRRTSLPRDRYNELRTEATRLAAEINDREVLEMRRELEEEATNTQQRQTMLRLQEEMERRQQVNDLIRRANKLRQDRKYDAAIRLLDQASFLDPNNAGIEGMRDTIIDSQYYQQYRKTLDTRTREIMQQSLENADASIPWTELLTYPADWPELTERRLKSQNLAVEESEENRATALKMTSSIPVNFDGVQLSNVIEYFRNTTDVDFFVNWSALEGANIQKDTLIELRLRDVPADKALDLVLQQASARGIVPLTWSIIDGIVHISTQEELRRKLVNRVYDIRDLQVQIPDFTNAPQIGLENTQGVGANNNNNAGGGFGGGGAGGGGAGGIFGGGGAGAGGGGGVDTLSAADMADAIMQLIRDTVGQREDWDTLGGPSTVLHFQGSLIVNTTEANHRGVVRLLKTLREERTIQIHVESRFLTVTQNFLEEVGLDLDFRVVNTGEWGDVNFEQDSFGLTAAPGTGAAGALGGGAGAALSYADFVGFNGIPSGDAGGFGSPVGGGTGRALDFSAGFLDDIEVTLLLRATRAHREAISLSAPRVTFFNGQTAYVTVVQQTSFISELETVTSGDAVGFQPTLGIINTGATLTITGTVSPDRRYVTLTLQPQISTLSQLRQVESSAAAGGGDGVTIDNTDGGQTGNGVITGTIEAPEINLTTTATSVSVPDKGTLLFGGQRLLEEITIESGVPILSKLPLLNRLFSNRSTVKDERTVLFLVKPTIIIQSEEEDRLFPGLLDNPTAYNVGDTLPTP